MLALFRMKLFTEIVLFTNGRCAQATLLAGNTEQRSYYSFVSLLTQLRNCALLQQYAEQKEGVISGIFNSRMEFRSRIPIILSIFSAYLCHVKYF